MEDLELIQFTLRKHGYEFKSFIGCGGFSSVLLCHSKKYSQDFAVKRAVKENLTKDECKTLISLNHSNIIKLYDVFYDGYAIYMVMEYCPNGTIRQKGKLSYSQFIYYAKQILEALAYCHSNKIAHRDIKPDNVFLDQNDNAKLADFGMAKVFEDDCKSKDKCGSLKYFAPELFQSKEVDPFKTDIWALGITFFCMATGEYPFKCHTREELKQNILIGNLNFLKYDTDPRIRFLIGKMVETKIELRRTAAQLLQLQIFNNSPEDTKLPVLEPLSGRSSLQSDFHPSMSMSFNAYHNSVSDENEKKKPVIPKLHSIRSVNHFPRMQRINCHIWSSRNVI